jgi:hypothetical protein
MKPAPLSGKQVFYDILAQRHSPLNFTLTLNLNRNRNLPTRGTRKNRTVLYDGGVAIKLRVPEQHVLA